MVASVLVSAACGCSAHARYVWTKSTLFPATWTSSCGSTVTGQMCRCCNYSEPNQAEWSNAVGRDPIHKVQAPI